MKNNLGPMQTFFLVALTSIALMGGALSWTLSLKRQRQPASTQVTYSKEQILLGRHDKKIHSHGKGNSSIEIDIQAPGKGQVSVGSVINLEATIDAKEDLRDVHFIWLMPKDGVSVVSGSVEGDLGTFSNGETKTVRLSVQSNTDENRQIHFHVYRVVNGENMGQMAQYNTVHQEAIEAQAASKAEALQREAEVTGTVLKVIQ